MSKQISVWLVVVLLAIGAGAAVWYYRAEQPASVAGPTAPAAPAPGEVPPAGPRFPVAPAMPERTKPENLMPLPALGDSDQYFRMELIDVLGSGMDAMLVDSALIEKFVASIDNLPRAQLAERIRPVGGVQGPFAADGQDGSAQYTLNPANYRRYDFIVELLARADQEALLDVYRRFYPLFQEAYVNLGYPQGYFNDRVVEVIDHLLETPTVDEPVQLVRPHVLYEFADPELEALSSGQKLLIRIGADHRARVKQFLEEMRERITGSDPTLP